MKSQTLFICCLLATTVYGRPNQGIQQSHKKASSVGGVPVHKKQPHNSGGFHQASAVGGFETPSSGGYYQGGGIIYDGLPESGQLAGSPDATFHGTPNAHNFGYQVADSLQGNKHGHTGFSDGETTKGEYRVLLPDGRTQIVTYSADPKSGFMARVTYEGTAKPYVPPNKEQQYPSGLGYNQ